MTPPAPITGSAMKAAIVSGPSRSIRSRSDCTMRAEELGLALAVLAEAVVMRAVVCSTRSTGRSQPLWL